MRRTATSVQGVPVQLTAAALEHIAAQHPELAGMEEIILDALDKPDRVVAGRAGEFVAVKQLAKRKWLAVVYRATSTEGFVITAFYLDRPGYYVKRRQIWP